PFRDGLAREAGERLGAGIDLDSGDDALLGQVLRKRRAVLGLLADGLVVKNDAADRLGRAGRGEQHLAVGAAVRPGRLQPDAVEALLDGAARLVRRENPLALGHHRAGNARELARIHPLLLRHVTWRAGCALPGSTERRRLTCD